MAFQDLMKQAREYHLEHPEVKPKKVAAHIWAANNMQGDEKRFTYLVVYDIRGGKKREPKKADEPKEQLEAMHVRFPKSSQYEGANIYVKALRNPVVADGQETQDKPMIELDLKLTLNENITGEDSSCKDTSSNIYDVSDDTESDAGSEKSKTEVTIQATQQAISAERKTESHVTTAAGHTTSKTRQQVNIEVASAPHNQQEQEPLAMPQNRLSGHGQNNLPGPKTSQKPSSHVTDRVKQEVVTRLAQPASAASKHGQQTGPAAPSTSGLRQPATSGLKQPATSGLRQPATSGLRQPATTRETKTDDARNRPDQQVTRAIPAPSGLRAPTAREPRYDDARNKQGQPTSRAAPAAKGLKPPTTRESKPDASNKRPSQQANRDVNKLHHEPADDAPAPSRQEAPVRTTTEFKMSHFTATKAPVTQASSKSRDPRDEGRHRGHEHANGRGEQQQDRRQLTSNVKQGIDVLLKDLQHLRHDAAGVPSEDLVQVYGRLNAIKEAQTGSKLDLNAINEALKNVKRIVDRKPHDRDFAD